MASLAVMISQHIKRIRFHILILVAIYFLSAHSLMADGDIPANNTINLVVIDPGHGGKDPGAVGSSTYEKDIVLAIALKLGQYIEENFENIRVIYTRKEDIFIPLHERAEIANKNDADLFISIHANWFTRNTSQGAETFVMGMNKNQSNFEIAKKENAVITLEEDYETKYEGFDPNSIDSYIIFSVLQNTHLDQSLNFAALVQNEFRTRVKRYDRGVKQAPFLVLWQTSMPSVLIETGFISHPEEEKFLNSKEGQDYMASAIFRAFRSYKEQIEESSRFETIVRQEDTPQNAVEKSEMSENQTENTSISSMAKEAFAPAENLRELYFRVQILSSRNRIDPDNTYFKNTDEVVEFNTGKMYKYAIGKSASYHEILDYCTEVKEDYPDAFVIAVKEGEIISMEEAIKEIHR